jgi:hypothetical protein
MDEVPQEVAREQLDSAMMAQLTITTGTAVEAAPPPAVVVGGPSFVVPLVLGVSLLLLLGLRALALGSTRLVSWSGRSVGAPPGIRPDGAAELGAPSAPVRARAAGIPSKAKAPSPTVALPPHVAAMLARLDEKRAAESAGPQAATTPAVSPNPPRAGPSGLDVLVGS